MADHTPKKQLFGEVDEYTDLQAGSNFDVHGAIVSVSPLKRGKTCQYFGGTLTDGSSMTFQ